MTEVRMRIFNPKRSRAVLTYISSTSLPIFHPSAPVLFNRISYLLYVSAGPQITLKKGIEKTQCKTANLQRVAANAKVRFPPSHFTLFDIAINSRKVSVASKICGKKHF